MTEYVDTGVEARATFKKIRLIGRSDDKLMTLDEVDDLRALIKYEDNCYQVMFKKGQQLYCLNAGVGLEDIPDSYKLYEYSVVTVPARIQQA